MLYLFDIDGTLVDTGGAGLAALRQATIEVFGQEGPPLDLAGSTDLALVAEIHSHFGLVPTTERIDAYFEIYHQLLDWNLTNGGFPGRVHDGVPELLSLLGDRSSAAIGLLTGNTAEGAAAKMRHFGLAGHFPFGAFGCDHADRNHLGPIALARASAHAGREFAPGETWVIGDTPKDVRCAHAMGARCLAVATGGFPATALESCGADRVVESLNQALAWI